MDVEYTTESAGVDFHSERIEGNSSTLYVDRAMRPVQLNPEKKFVVGLRTFGVPNGFHNIHGEKVQEQSINVTAEAGMRDDNFDEEELNGRFGYLTPCGLIEDPDHPQWRQGWRFASLPTGAYGNIAAFNDAMHYIMWCTYDTIEVYNEGDPDLTMRTNDYTTSTYFFDLEVNASTGKVWLRFNCPDENSRQVGMFICFAGWDEGDVPFDPQFLDNGTLIGTRVTKSSLCEYFQFPIGVMSPSEIPEFQTWLPTNEKLIYGSDLKIYYASPNLAAVDAGLTAMVIHCNLADGSRNGQKDSILYSRPFQPTDSYLNMICGPLEGLIQWMPLHDEMNNVISYIEIYLSTQDGKRIEVPFAAFYDLVIVPAESVLGGK